MRCAGGLLVALVLGAAQAHPQETPGPHPLWAGATLYRDAWGVPHVYADSPEALGFAHGYAQAADHIEPMLFAYRVANGRAAEIAGEAWAESDAFSIAMGHARLGGAALNRLDPFTRELCGGFAQGVNAWLYDHPDQAPAWALGVAPADVLALWHAFVMSMAPYDLPNHYRRAHAMKTGNAWALTPDRTEAGHTLFVMSPHQYHMGPFRWYETHLVLGDYDMHGATLYGLPLPLMGHNGAAAWALTPNWPDFADMFEEEVVAPRKDPRDPRYSASLMNAQQAIALEFMANARPYYVRTPAGIEERYIPALIGDRGPVFDRGGNDFYSWTVGGYRDFGGFYQLYEMGRAKNHNAFQAALLMQQLPCFHITYADRSGALFYLYNAKAGTRDLLPEVIAEREKHGMQRLTWQEPLSAVHHANAWGEVVSPNMLPYVLNPETGYIQACGSPPWNTTENTGINPDSWPPWFIQDADTYRSHRVRRLLRTGTRDFADMQRMVFDAVVPAAVDLAPKIAAAAANDSYVHTAHPDLPAVIDALGGWSGVADVDAPGMTLYHVWWQALREEHLPAFDRDDQLYEALQTGTQDVQQAMLTAAAETARNMRNELGRVDVPWGEVHRIRRGEREEPIAGAATGEPVFLTSDVTYRDGKWYADYGFAYALAVEFSDPPRARSVSIFGASENPASPHFDDQLDLVLEKRMKPMHTTPDAVSRHAENATGTHVILRAPGVAGTVQLTAQRVVTASMESGLEPPAEPPEDRVAYTPYITPAYTPGDVAVQRTIRLCMPESVVAPQDLGELALYAHEEGLGWYPLEGIYDTETGCIEATHRGGATYAVLGPPEVRIEPPAAKTIPAMPIDGQAPPEPEGSPPEPEGESPEQPRTWDATDQEAPRTFTFEVIDEASLPDKAPGEAPGTADTDTPAPADPGPVPRPRPREGKPGTFKLDIIDPSALPDDADRQGGQVIYGDIPGESGHLRVQRPSQDSPAPEAPPLTPAKPAPDVQEAEPAEGEGETGGRTFKLETLEEPGE